MRKVIRFSDLKEKGYVNSWPGLMHLIKTQGFPPGYKFGPQTHIWYADEVEQWIERRQFDPNTVNDNAGLQKARAVRAAKRAAKRQEEAANVAS